ncbi:MAG TPA: MlaD family protein [Terriglobia bacterium]|nr:MlaD family protein [Terriglobia bacterium]
MPRKKQIEWAQLRVGVFVLVSLVVLGVGIFFISGQVGGFLSRRYTLKTYFASAGGVHEGAEVRLAGIAVGNVSKIQLSPFQDPNRAVEVLLKVTKHYQDNIRADSVASIETAGLLGDGYIDITRGGPGQAILPNNGVVKSQEEADIKEIVKNANDVVSNLRVLSSALNEITGQIKTGNGSIHQLLYDPTLANRMNATTADLDSLLSRVQKGEGTLGKLMADETVYKQTVDALNRLNQMLDDAQHGKGSMAKFMNDPSVYDNLRQLEARGNTLIDKLNNGQGTIGKMVNDPQLYNRMNETVARLDTISERIDKGEGTFGKLSTDASLFNNLNESSKTLREFLNEFMKNPRKYLTLHMHLF